MVARMGVAALLRHRWSISPNPDFVNRALRTLVKSGLTFH